MIMNDIIIRDQRELDEKILSIQRDGIDSLHIVADFDNTLTKAYVNGGKFQSAIAQIRAGGYLSEDYTARAYALYDEYHPIEINPTIPNDKKNRFMEEWWQRHLDLQVRSGMNRGILEQINSTNKIQLRDKVISFFKNLFKYDVPILVLSAGLGDLIEMNLKKNKIYYDNVFVLSNFYEFNLDGSIKGYKGKIIHTFNKDESEIELLPHYKKIERRKNIILLGDSLGDLEMSYGIKHNNIIKIGFYNKTEKEDDFKKFIDGYDVLITKDGDFSYILQLFKELI